MNQLLIAANLGSVRVLRFREPGDDPIEQRHLEEVPEVSGRHHVAAIHEAVTDQSGRFARGNRVGLETGMSCGEEHNLELEMERGSLKHTAHAISDILAAEHYPRWLLAAPQPILAALQDCLPAPALKSLREAIGADLTRTPLAELEERFV